MANFLANTHLVVFVVFECLFGPVGILGYPDVAPDPLLQESIVPERDLTPRNFNPHPYVSVAKGGSGIRGVGGRESDVLSNFDHPYAALASKRSSGYFRNGRNTGVRVLDNQNLDPDRTDPGKMSINTLANFARRFLGLTDGFNGKKPSAVPTNDAVRDKINIRNPAPSYFSTLTVNHPIGEYRRGSYQEIDYNINLENRQLYDGNDIDAVDADRDENGGRITPFYSTNLRKDQILKHKVYLRKTLNLASSSIQQFSLNEDALSPGDTNDNLSQGLYLTEKEHNDNAPDVLDRGIESYEKPLYFITPKHKYHYLITDEFHVNNNRYSLY